MRGEDTVKDRVIVNLHVGTAFAAIQYLHVMQPLSIKGIPEIKTSL